MSEFKKCSDCIYFRPGRIWDSCSHYRNVSIKVVSDYANGIGPHEKEVELFYTDDLRRKEDHCGPEAKWFEPRPPRTGFWAWLLGDK